MSIELPTCLEAEQAVLGYILLSGDGFHRVADILSADDFSEEIHRRIFTVAASLVQDGRPPNMIVVMHHLGDHDLGGGLSTGKYLSSICAAENICTASTLAPMAKHVRDTSDTRQLVLAAKKTIERITARVPGLTPSTIAADLIAEADRIAASAAPSTMQAVTIGQAGRAAYIEAAERRAGKPSSGVQTGISDLDAIVGALEPGQGSLLAGRPSMGKTALALSIAVNVARAGHGVLYVSLEMGAEPLATRVLSLVTAERGAGAPYFRIAKGQVNAVELAGIERASAELDVLPIVIEQRSSLTVSQIVAKARKVKQQFAAQGTPLRLVIVDHLGLVRPSSRYSGLRTLEIGEISAGLHALARELDAHCLGLSQLNRNAETRADKRPQLSDLRDSGDLEQNSDLVLSVYREAYYLERSSQPEDYVRLLEVENRIEVSILKNRQGPIGRADLWADMPCNLVRSLPSAQSTSTANRKAPHLRPVHSGGE